MKEKKPFVIPREIFEQFTRGGCSGLAAVLAEHTGWQAYITYHFDQQLKDEYGDGWEIHHAFVVNDDGNAVDIQGVHKDNRARLPGENLVGKRTESVSVGQLRGWHDNYHEDDAWNLLEDPRFREHFGIKPLVK